MSNTNKIITTQSTQLVNSNKRYNKVQQAYWMAKLYLAMRFNVGEMSLDDIVEVRDVVLKLRTANARRWAAHIFTKKIKPKLLRAAFKNQNSITVKICRKNHRNILRWQQLLRYCKEQGYKAIPYEGGSGMIWSPVFFQLIIELPDGSN